MHRRLLFSLLPALAVPSILRPTAFFEAFRAARRG